MGCVRINDGKNFMSEVVVDLPETRITYDQLDSIELFLDNLAAPIVTVGCTIKGIFQHYNLNEVSTSAIRRKIIGFYNSGTLHEECESFKD
jgi:hypothetical protein